MAMADLTARCDDCDLPLATCPHGNAEAAAADAAARRGYASADLIADGPTIEATQSHPCPAGDGLIHYGDSITHTDEGWAHTRCVTSRTTPPETDTSTFEGID
jgi:hypothetical protein